MSTDKVDAREASGLSAVTIVSKLRRECAMMIRANNPLLEQAKQLEQALPELLKFAALGKVAMRFVDRAGDVHTGIDDAETICSEFHRAISDEVNHQAAAQEGK